MQLYSLYFESDEILRLKGGVSQLNAARKLGDMQLTTCTYRRTIQMDSSIRISKDEDKKWACLQEMLQESWEIFDVRLGSLAFEDYLYYSSYVNQSIAKTGQHVIQVKMLVKLVASTGYVCMAL
ncbi:unnamed protein product [Boreogadus saida]